MAMGLLPAARQVRPSGLGLLFTPWRFDTPLLFAGIATTAAIIYLLVLLRTGRLTPIRLIATAGFYSAFALALAGRLDHHCPGDVEQRELGLALSHPARIHNEQSEGPRRRRSCGGAQPTGR